LLQIREVFKCKPGQAKHVVEKFKKASEIMNKEGGFTGMKIMVDYIASYWTVVLETEVESIDEFEKHMQHYAGNIELQKAMEGYMDLLEGGHREVYRIM
jgi:heme-degrading monooxygenase HmoA